MSEEDDIRQERLRLLVAELSAPHPNNCDPECGGGRTDCCDQCELLESLVPAVRTFNSLHRNEPSITLPAWCASVRTVHVGPKPLPEFQDEYCRTCWHRLKPAAIAATADAFGDTLKRYYPEKLS